MNKPINMIKDELVRTAIEYRQNAYAPYSNFKVGAAVQGGSGKIYGGCNMENASYGLTICAERSAITRAVAAGEREITRVAVVTEAAEVSMPCGACRQVILEFGREADILCCDVEGNCNKYTTGELMPNFDDSDAFRNKLEEVKNKPK